MALQCRSTDRVHDERGGNKQESNRGSLLEVVGSDRLCLFRESSKFKATSKREWTCRTSTLLTYILSAVTVKVAPAL